MLQETKRNSIVIQVHSHNIIEILSKTEISIQKHNLV